MSRVWLLLGALSAIHCNPEFGQACEDACNHAKTCQDTITQKGCLRTCDETFDAEYADQEGCQQLYLDYLNCFIGADFGCGITMTAPPKDSIAPDCAAQLDAFQMQCANEEGGAAPQ